MLVLSYSVGLIGFDPDRVVALRGIDSLTFKRPVAIGETIRAEADVDSVQPIDDHHELVVLRWRVLGADERVTLRARITIVHRPTPGPGTRHGGQTSGTESNGASEALYGERVLL
jgi:acyl dehydratase